LEFPLGTSCQTNLFFPFNCTGKHFDLPIAFGHLSTQYFDPQGIWNDGRTGLPVIRLGKTFRPRCLLIAHVRATNMSQHAFNQTSQHLLFKLQEGGKKIDAIS